MTQRLGNLAAAAAMIVLSACATGPSATGKWNASMDTPQGAFEMAFDLMAEGKNLTGTMSNDFMGSVPISEGMVDGNALSFKVSVEGGPGGALTMNYKGMLDGDQIAFNMGFEGSPPPGAPESMEFTAQRAAE